VRVAAYTNIVNACRLNGVPESTGTRARQRADTQRRILTAARKLFADAGYERTTIRAIAATASTDPGLVMRYFGSKQQLFAQVADMPAETVTPGDPDQITEALLASLTDKLVTEPTATMAMLRSMLTHPDAASHVRDAANRQEQQLAATIPADDAALRAGLIGAVTLGTIIARHLLRLDGLRTATPEQITTQLRPHIRALLADNQVSHTHDQHGDPSA
jgi:AcrR family transcriptional regulator